MILRRLEIWAVVLVAFAFSFVVTCEREETPKRVKEGDLLLLKEQRIEASKGASIKIPEGIILEVPPKVLSATTVARIYKNNKPPTLPNVPFLHVIGDCYQIDLGDATILDSLRLTIPFSLANFPAEGQESNLTLAFYGKEGWIMVGGLIDSAGHSISIRTMHLSNWIVLLWNEPKVDSNHLCVPYYYQGDYPWCAFTSMAMIGKYHGRDIENYQIAGHLKKGPGDYLTARDMLVGSVSEVYNKLLTPGNNPSYFFFAGATLPLFRKLVEHAISRNEPVYVWSLLYFHAFVVVGYDQQSISIHDPGGAFTGPDRPDKLVSCKLTWYDFYSKISPWVLSGTPLCAIVSLYQPSDLSTRKGTIEIATYKESEFSCLEFMTRGAYRLLFWWDGKYPEGYYFADPDNKFPEDPNEDGCMLLNCPTTISYLNLSPRITNITDEKQMYKVYAKIFARDSRRCVYNCSESIYKHVKIRSFSSEDPKPLFSIPLAPNKLSPGAYRVTLYLKQNEVLQDSVAVYFNLVEGRNLSPTKPTIISGQSVAYTDEVYSFSATAEDPDGDRMSFRFSWDNDISEWSSDVQSGGVVSMSHSWISAGTHTVRVQAKDVHGAKSAWSEFQTITIKEKNRPPIPPRFAVAASDGYTGVSCEFIVQTNDPDGDSVNYRYDWGDGEISPWGFFGPSGVQLCRWHSWGTPGIYSVRSQAIDTHGDVSDWSQPHTVRIASMPSPQTTQKEEEPEPKQTEKEKKKKKGFWESLSEGLEGVADGIHETSDNVYGEKEERGHKTQDYSYESRSFDAKIRTSISTIYARDIFQKAEMPEFYVYFSSTRDAQVEISVQQLGDCATQGIVLHFGERNGYFVLTYQRGDVQRTDFDNSPKLVWQGWAQGNEEKSVRMGGAQFSELKRLNDLLKSYGGDTQGSLSGGCANFKYVFYISARDNSGNMATNKIHIYLAF